MIIRCAVLARVFPVFRPAVFTQMTPPPGSSGGLLNAIAGSLILTVIGVLVGTPLGLLGGHLYPRNTGAIRGWPPSCDSSMTFCSALRRSSSGFSSIRSWWFRWATFRRSQAVLRWRSCLCRWCCARPRICSASSQHLAAGRGPGRGREQPAPARGRVRVRGGGRCARRDAPLPAVVDFCPGSAPWRNGSVAEGLATPRPTGRWCSVPAARPGSTPSYRR